MEDKGLLEDFIEQYWPNGKTSKGKNRIARLKRLYESFSSQIMDEDDSEEEGSSFAYEEDLKNFLAANLAVIEKGLKLYRSKDGQEGIEYPIDENKKRIDILALDKAGVPTIIELKVSRGYEKVIGQCLYYKAMVKKLFSAKRVKIIIIAREINENLRFATDELENVELFEYKLSVKLDRIK